MSESKDVTLEDVITDALDAWLSDVHTAMPGQIVEYDQASRRAMVQPLVKERYIDESGMEVIRAHAPIPDVPVMMVGSGVERVRFPIANGDECLILACSSPLAGWKQAGGLSDPVAARRHHLADAIAIVGLSASAPSGVPMIDITDNGVALGDPAATEPALRGDTFLSELSTLVSAIGDAVGGIPSGGGVAKAAIIAALHAFESSANSYTSDRVKLR